MILKASSYDKVRENVIETISKLNNWIAMNKLVLNAEKTQIINFHHSRNKRMRPTTLKIDSKEIDYVKSTKVFRNFHQRKLILARAPIRT